MQLKKMVVLCAMGLAGIAHSSDVHWSYEGEDGPESWSKLSPEYSLCATGRNQSPINIEGVLKTHHKPLSVHYTQSGKEIVNNGHTVQVNFKPGNSIVLEDGTYELKQVHFHAPSENHIAGKTFPMEAHFVHVHKNGDLAVIAVMFKEGKENPALQTMWAQLPQAKGDPIPLAASIKPEQLMPHDKTYLRFTGSLTTPPCSEGVRWFVFKRALSASKGQIESFAKIVDYHNNRPLQPLNGRVVIQ